MSGDLWNVVLGFTTLIGFALAIWQTLRAEQLNRRQRDLDWPRFRNASSDLARSIDRSDWHPDFILAISERGAIVAHLVARELRSSVPIVTVAYLAKPEPARTVPGFVTISGSKATAFLPEGLAEMNTSSVLILDDFVMSGDGLERIRRALLDRGFSAERIRSGAVVVTRLAVANKKGPDYYAREARDFDFYFPWGRAE